MGFGAGLMALSCAATDGGGRGGTIDTGGGNSGGAGNAAGFGVGGPGMGAGAGQGFGGFAGTAGTGTLEDGGECAAFSQTADNSVRPIDIIWAVDNSCSMTFEAQEVQNNMNTFASAILNQGIDVHVVLISESGPAGGFPPSNGICLPAPLGSGQCPNDSNLPRYMRVDDEVASSNSLLKLLEHYPTYKSVLRQNALKYFAVVTDDESQLSSQDFINQLGALDPGWFDFWRFFGVFCTGSCTGGFPPPCANTGTVYQELCNASGTTAGDLCQGQSNFSGVFAALAQTVQTSQQLDCQWKLPPPPPGETLDPSRVNVQYTPGGQGQPVPIYKVGSAAECGPQGGWYYDNPQAPTTVFVCPSNCQQMTTDLAGKVDILTGCATIEVPK